MNQKQEPKPQPAATVYPTKTTGSETATEIRKKANGLTDIQREDLFKQGMRIIYGGAGTKETVRS